MPFSVRFWVKIGKLSLRTTQVRCRFTKFMNDRVHFRRRHTKCCRRYGVATSAVPTNMTYCAARQGSQLHRSTATNTSSKILILLRTDLLFVHVNSRKHKFSLLAPPALANIIPVFWGIFWVLFEEKTPPKYRETSERVLPVPNQEHIHYRWKPDYRTFNGSQCRDFGLRNYYWTLTFRGALESNLMLAWKCLEKYLSRQRDAIIIEQV